MDIFDAISERRSIRKFTKETVSRETIEKIVDAGRKAPTARAVEPWEFVVVTERSSLKRLGSIASTGTFIKDAACCIAVFSSDTKYYLEDGCAATENILLAATGMGLGACWVAGDKKPYAQTVAKMLGAGDNMKLVSLIPIGYPDGEVPVREIRTLSDVIHWERME